MEFSGQVFNIAYIAKYHLRVHNRLIGTISVS